jgi:tetratricopeptide (TPR) repeat protein
MEQHAEALLELSRSERFQDYQVFADVALAYALLERNEKEQGIAQLRETVESLIKNNLWEGPLLSLVAYNVGTHGDISLGIKLVSGGINLAQNKDVCWWEAEHHRILGQLLLAQKPSDTKDAEECFKQAIEVAQRQGAKTLELRASISLAHLWCSHNKPGAAHELLVPIHGWFTEGLDTPDLKEASALLERLVS